MATGINKRMAQWRDSGAHLPKFMRDFHDAKDLFKTIAELTMRPADTWPKPISWVDGQIYVIDTFLWFMARHGYTLQKNRSKIEFDDVEESIEYVVNMHRQSFKSILKQGTKE